MFYNFNVSLVFEENVRGMDAVEAWWSEEREDIFKQQVSVRDIPPTVNIGDD